MGSWFSSCSSNTTIMKVFCFLMTMTGMALADHAAHHLPHHPVAPHNFHFNHAAPAPVHAAPLLHHAAPVHPAPLLTHAPLVHHAHAPLVHHAPAPYHAPAPVHPAPYHPPEPYHEGPPKNYEFGYAVAEKDEYGNPNVHSRHETRDGPTVKGQYTVQLPDCRTQIVDYFVDEYKQYHADVKYEGTICEPHPAPYHTPAPVAPYHAPAPLVHHAPAPLVHHAPVHPVHHAHAAALHG